MTESAGRRRVQAGDAGGAAAVVWGEHDTGGRAMQGTANGPVVVRHDGSAGGHPAPYLTPKGNGDRSKVAQNR